MDVSIEAIVFIVLLVDSIGANLVAWTSGRRWYQRHFRILSRWFPASRGWTTWYLMLVLWIGVLVFWL